MRAQTKKMQELVEEYDNLKKELFGECKFVVLDQNSDTTKRYNQLLQFFFPQFRTKDFITPL